MRICLYYKATNKPWGGTNFFVLNLRKFFIKNNIDITYDINSDYDILFLNSAYKAPGKLFKIQEISKIKNKGYSSVLWRMFAKNKKRKVKILYRLDGLRKVYANLESKMDDIQLKCIHYADQIVFQSKFAYEMFKRFGYPGSNFSIIHNGINKDIFNIKDRLFWDGKSKLKIMACSWSKNHAKGHKIIADFSQLSDVDVHFIGSWPDDIPHGDVKMHGVLNQQKMANLFRQSHIFLFPSLNESCSNSLLEALACGLPVLYIDSGSNRELAGKYGEEINAFDFRTSLEKIKDKHCSLVEKIKQDNEKFSIESVGRKYLDICRKM